MLGTFSAFVEWEKIPAENNKLCFDIQFRVSDWCPITCQGGEPSLGYSKQRSLQVDMDRFHEFPEEFVDNDRFEMFPEMMNVEFGCKDPCKTEPCDDIQCYWVL